MMREETIKEKTFKLLDTNSLLLPKQICKILNLDYNYYANYITVLRSKWKSSFEKRRGLRRLTFHHVHAFVYVPSYITEDYESYVKTATSSLTGGWIKTEAKNHMMVWRDDKLGRLEWFPTTGRVKIWVKKPASKGKCYQLLANAFFRTALIFDIRNFEPFLKGVKFKGASAVIDVGEKLPYEKIDFLRISNGVVITLGDRSHPTAVEIDFCLPDWAERNEILNERIEKLLSSMLDLMSKNQVEHPEPEQPYWA